MKKILILAYSVFLLGYALFALAEKTQPLGTEIKNLAEEAKYHAKLDRYNVFYPLGENKAYKRGEAFAVEDFENGNYRVLVYGLRPSNTTLSEEYLRQNYGIEFYPIAGCIVSDGIIGGAKGYNAKMKSLLKEKYGKDVFKEAETVERESE